MYKVYKKVSSYKLYKQVVNFKLWLKFMFYTLRSGLSPQEATKAISHRRIVINEGEATRPPISGMAVHRSKGISTIMMI